MRVPLGSKTSGTSEKSTGMSTSNNLSTILEDCGSFISESRDILFFSNALKLNDPPSEDEALVLKNICRASRERISILQFFLPSTSENFNDSDPDGIKPLYTPTYRCIKELKRLEAECTQALGAVRYLPTEILGLIFSYCPPSELIQCPSENLLLLGQICSTWRNVSIRIPHLWNHIFIDPFLLTTPRKEKADRRRKEKRYGRLLRCLAERSKHLPLYLSLRIRFSYEDGKGTFAMERESCQKLLRSLLKPYVHRIRNLEVAAQSTQHIGSLLQFPGNSFRLLECFILRLDEPRDWFDYSSPSPAFINASSLRRVLIYNLGFNPIFTLPWCQITHLSLTSRLLSHEYAKILMDCKKLQDGVFHVEGSAVIPNIHPVHLPDLISLSVITRPSIYDSLSPVYIYDTEFPALRILRVGYISGATQSWIPACSSDHHLPSVRKLSLVTDITMIRDVIKELLMACPQLETLELEIRTDFQLLFQDLLESANVEEKRMLPNLKHLLLDLTSLPEHLTVPISTLKAIVGSRFSPAKSSLGNIKQLQAVTVLAKGKDKIILELIEKALRQFKSKGLTLSLETTWDPHWVDPRSQIPPSKFVCRSWDGEVYG